MIHSPAAASGRLADVVVAVVVLASLAPLSSGCARTPAACDPLCADAERLVSACLDDWGQAWGDGFGYADPDDYLNWCETYPDEQAELAHGRWPADEAAAQLLEACTEQVETLQGALDEGDCAAYPDSWVVWEAFGEGG